MTLKSRHFYEFGPFRVIPAEHLLLYEEHPVALTPKAFDLLMVLVRNHGRLLQKDELMRAVWPDSFVEEANLTVNISTLRKALGEQPSGRHYIETVPRRGYRFNAPVEELEEKDKLAGVSAEPFHAVNGAGTVRPALTEAGAQPACVAPRPQVSWGSGQKRLWLPLGVLLGIAMVAFGYSLYRRHVLQSRSFEGPRSLAVLPFKNLKQDPECNFLGLSLADVVISKLGYVSALTVRPSYAVERYRNQPIDIPKVAAELNVDTMLTGSFIRDGRDLRITSELIDVKGNKLLWTGSFNLKYQDLLTVQDDVARQIIRGLKLKLSASEKERLKPDDAISPLAYEYYLRGVDLYSRSDFPMALKMLEKSAEIEPKYAPTWSYLGRSYNANASFEFGGRELYGKAEAAFQKSLSLQPEQIDAYIWMANMFTDTGRVERAVSLLRQALKTNPNHAEVHWELGYAYRFAGVLAESVSECELARRLDPDIKLNSSALNSYLYLGQYAKFLQSLPKSRDIAFNLFYRGFAEYYQREWDQAAKDLDRAFELDPSLLHSQVGKALSDAIRRRAADGIELLRAAERKIEDRGVGDPEAIYKIAQAYAVLGDRRAALRVLRRSIENGFFCYPYLMTDPLLDRLRQEAEFAGMMESARQRHAAFKRAFF